MSDWDAFITLTFLTNLNFTYLPLFFISSLHTLHANNYNLPLFLDNKLYYPRT
jgi:hypothetical protein